MSDTTASVLKVIGVVIAIVAVIWFMFWAISKIDWSTMSQPTQYSAPATEQKPATKTRCDFTGVLSSQIIEDEAANGYMFAGRVNTFLCGENGLSFYLRQDQ